MNLQPTLQNDLVILRPLRANDFTALYKVAIDPLLWEQHQIKDRYKNEVYTKFFADSIKSKGALIIIDKSSKDAIGSTRFQHLENVANAIEIGWSFISRKYWGGLYNKSIKKLMIDYALGFMTDVVFDIDRNNIRSQKAAEKIGGKRIIGPNLKHLVRFNETDWTYRINKEDWVK